MSKRPNMSKKIEPSDLEKIDGLIRAEIGQALDHFRAGDFEARVRRRLAAAEKPSRGRAPFLVKSAVPAAGAVLLAILAGVIAIVDPGRKPVRTPIDAGLFATVLRELPPFARAALNPSAGRPPAKETAPGAGAIANVLGSAGSRPEGGVGEAGSGDTAPKAPHLTMKKRMEILFKDKVIERVLLSCAPRSKEV
jgi:hypothetical protein